MKTILLSILLSVPAWCWSGVGHKVVAAICYDELSRPTRAKVDALIRAHPDYGAWIAAARPGASAPSIARTAFINASAWADDIKGDTRFYDDTRRDALPTPPLTGYPDMMRHTNWHYINFYFSPDSTPFPPVPTPNVLTQMPMVVDGLNGPNASYYLGWFLHLAGDLHQPMHSVSRFVAWNKDRNDRPQSDLGGNGVNVDGYTNLHSVWDDALGGIDDERYIDWMARRLRKEFKAENPALLDPEKWSQEGFELAKREAYKFGPEFGSNEKPFRRTPEYTKNALAVARRQGARAGRRMAALLNARLK